MEIFLIFKQSLSITLFVLSMMLIIDYLNVLSRGLWSRKLQDSPWRQILLGTVLGIIPGCLGAYTAVSLYVHNIIGTGALVATMIATSGDESFFMFSMIPETAILIHVLLFVIALATGFIVQFFSKKQTDRSLKHFDIHKDEPECVCFEKKIWIRQIRHISRIRFILLILLILTAFVVVINFNNLLKGLELLGAGEHPGHDHPEWVGITFLAVLAISLFIILTASDHFLKEHLVNHILKKHSLKIFLWTFGTLLALYFLIRYIDLDNVISSNLFLVLLFAILIGIIPESGPHLIFVILFAAGSIPLSILLANSIVQDGHGSLPLLAESQKSFIKIKTINIIAGFIIGGLGLLAGF
ncbi:MAG: hypothetical protein GXO86_02185 [Chlorobi bacterium]|nr:hypothetical protein [Chlorobiota bacterium]